MNGFTGSENKTNMRRVHIIFGLAIIAVILVVLSLLQII